VGKEQDIAELDCWIVQSGLQSKDKIGFWIWIANYIFEMDLDWIDNPK